MSIFHGSSNKVDGGRDFSEKTRILHRVKVSKKCPMHKTGHCLSSRKEVWPHSNFLYFSPEIYCMKKAQYYRVRSISVRNEYSCCCFTSNVSHMGTE